MAFWGTEVKPGKPFTHNPDSARERLHISQATLGNYGNASAKKKSVVQCNIGNKSPVFLCSLFPEQSESCQLNLEFDESVDVVFSVIGPRSVHLTGYYLRSSAHCSHHDDDHSESYGEDIADTETERSAGDEDEDEDEYEDSFIDDDDPLLVTPSPVSSDGEAAEALRKNKPKNKKASYRRLRKKYQIQSDEENTSQQHDFANGGTSVEVLDSESEDKLTISSLCKSAARNAKPKAEENAKNETSQIVNKEAENGGNGSINAEENADTIVGSQVMRQPDQHDSIQHSAEVDFDNGSKPNKKKKKQSEKEKVLEVGLEDGAVLKWAKPKQNERKVDQSSQAIDVKNEEDPRNGTYIQPDQPESLLASTEVGFERNAKSRKKKKTHSKEEKELKTEIEDDSVIKLDEVKQSETEVNQWSQDIYAKNEEDQRTAHYKQPNQPDYLLRSTEVGLESSGKPKKKKKMQPKEEKELKAGIGDASVLKQDQAKQSETKHDQSSQDLYAKIEGDQRNANYKQPDQHESPLNSSEVGLDSSAKPKKKKKQSKEEKEAKAGIGDNSVLELESKADQSSQDIPVKNEEEQKTGNDKNIVLSMPLDSQMLSTQLGLENYSKLKRKRKRSAEDKTIEADGGINANDIKKDKVNQDEFKSDGLEGDGTLQDEQNRSNLEQSVNDNHSRKRKKKKKKISQTQENGEALDMEESKDKSHIGIEDNNTQTEKPFT
ncbi:peptidyl-prolyl cis-trans isomerase FKBP43 [Ricinus communis]|nr:peptidyl-prolyl cis-trans isomerase FKBP43 [Ricinus communis]